jgi:hypothetical protein
MPQARKQRHMTLEYTYALEPPQNTRAQLRSQSAIQPKDVLAGSLSPPDLAVRDSPTTYTA